MTKTAPSKNLYMHVDVLKQRTLLGLYGWFGVVVSEQGVRHHFERADGAQFFVLTTRRGIYLNSRWFHIGFHFSGKDTKRVIYKHAETELAVAQ